MHKLAPADFAKVRHLFQPCDYRVYVEAVLSDASPGELYVDDIDHPSAALMATLEPYLLVGSPENPRFKADLKVFLVSSSPGGRFSMVVTAFLLVSIQTSG